MQLLGCQKINNDVAHTAFNFGLVSISLTVHPEINILKPETLFSTVKAESWDLESWTRSVSNRLCSILFSFTPEYKAAGDGCN